MVSLVSMDPKCQSSCFLEWQPAMTHCAVSVSNVNTSKLTKSKLDRILGSKEYYFFFFFSFGNLVICSVIWFSIYSVLWIRSTIPARFVVYNIWKLLDHLTAVGETLWTRGPSLRALSQIFCFQSPETEIELRTECLTGYADASLPFWRHAATWTHGTWSELSGNISQPPEPDMGTGMRTEYLVHPST